MGVGFVVICEPDAADGVAAQLAGAGFPAWRIGDVRAGEAGVEIAG